MKPDIVSAMADKLYTKSSEQKWYHGTTLNHLNRTRKMNEDVFDNIIATNFLSQDGVTIAEVLTESLNAYTDDSAYPISIAKAVTELTEAARSVANAITPLGVLGSHDKAGTFAESLTEAVMGNTAGLVKIAESIDRFTAEVTAIAKHFSRS